MWAQPVVGSADARLPAFQRQGLGEVVEVSGGSSVPGCFGGVIGGASPAHDPPASLMIAWSGSRLCTPGVRQLIQPVSGEIAGAIARFFHAGEGPSHSAISRALASSGYGDGYAYDPDTQGPNKESRILAAFAEARRRPDRGRQLTENVLDLLRLDGYFEQTPPNEHVEILAKALLRSGWQLDADGILSPLGDINLDAGGRPALEEQLARLRRSMDDPALLLGTAKDLLEAITKFVLVEHGFTANDKMSFDQLWHLARERLGILPQQVDTSLTGYEEIRRIHQSTWSIAEQANRLRNLQGTGHGRTLPGGVSRELALLVVREACSVGEYMLSLLERSHGR